MEHEIKTEELSNKQRKHKIEILKREYEDSDKKYTNEKRVKTALNSELQFKLYNETHTKDILTVERQVFFDKVGHLKAEN